MNGHVVGRVREPGRTPPRGVFSTTRDLPDPGAPLVRVLSWATRSNPKGTSGHRDPNPPNPSPDSGHARAFAHIRLSSGQARATIRCRSAASHWACARERGSSDWTRPHNGRSVAWRGSASKSDPPDQRGRRWEQTGRPPRGLPSADLPGDSHDPGAETDRRDRRWLAGRVLVSSALRADSCACSAGGIGRRDGGPAPLEMCAYQSVAVTSDRSACRAPAPKASLRRCLRCMALRSARRAPRRDGETACHVDNTGCDPSWPGRLDHSHRASTPSI